MHRLYAVPDDFEAVIRIFFPKRKEAERLPPLTAFDGASPMHRTGLSIGFT